MMSSVIKVLAELTMTTSIAMMLSSKWSPSMVPLTTASMELVAVR